MVDRAIGVYFLCSPRQPLWLFDRGHTLSPDSAEELLLVILAISVLYSSDDVPAAELQSSQSYSDAARSLIMLRIANASVQISTLQAFTLLAFYNLVGELAPLVPENFL
jgi:hypothetical protein